MIIIQLFFILKIVYSAIEIYHIYQAFLKLIGNRILKHFSFPLNAFKTMVGFKFLSANNCLFGGGKGLFFSSFT